MEVALWVKRHVIVSSGHPRYARSDMRDLSSISQYMRDLSEICEIGLKYYVTWKWYNWLTRWWYPKFSAPQAKILVSLCSKNEKRLVFGRFQWEFIQEMASVSVLVLRDMRDWDMRDFTPGSQYMRDFPPISHIICERRKLCAMSILRRFGEFSTHPKSLVSITFAYLHDFLM